jgi:hypothetical protein
MSKRSAIWATVAIAALGAAACKTNQPSTPDSSGEASVGTPAPASAGGSGGTPGTGGSGSSIPTLVSVNLQNVLNDLSVSLQVNRNNIPVTAQVPIAVAASVCGVTVEVLAASVANGHASCTATTTSPQLTQAVQQQIASGGSVTGGPQTMGGTPTNEM